MYVCICVYMYVCMYVCICMRVCMYVYVCVCIHVYVCMHNIWGNCSGGNVLSKTGGELSGGIVRGKCPGGIVRGNCPTPPNLNSRELSYTPKPKPYSGNLEPMLPVSAFEISRTAVHTVGRSSKT